LEAERVGLSHLQLAPATDLLYIGVQSWDRPEVSRVLAWDLKEQRLRAELNLNDPLLTFRPSSDGAHLYGLTAIRPGEEVTRLVVIEVATGRVIRTLGQFQGGVFDWAVLPK
jgi:hypothetical protein